MAPALRHRQADRIFERLYRAHVGEVYRYALAVTGNQADAEDVTQTTFMNVYRALERGERPSKPQHWLIAIAHNVCRQRFRQAARRPTEVVFEEDAAEALVPSDDVPSAADIQRALGGLPLNQREALVMRELEGRSYVDIGELLGLSISAVETLLFRGRRALREQLEGTLTCSEAEAAISRQLDGRLSRAERGGLRAHLRECEECRHLARSQRAQRHGWKALAAVPLPPSLVSWAGGGGAVGIGAGAAAKVAAVTVAAVVAGGGGYAVVRHETASPHHQAKAAVVFPLRTSAPSHATVTHAPVVARKKKGRPATTVAVAATTAVAPAAGGAGTGTTTPPPATVPGQAAHGTSPAHPVHPSHPATPARAQHTHTSVKPKQQHDHPSVQQGSTGQQTPTPPPANPCKPANPAAPAQTTSEPTSTVEETSEPCPAANGNGDGAGSAHSSHP